MSLSMKKNGVIRIIITAISRLNRETCDIFVNLFNDQLQTRECKAIYRNALMDGTHCHSQIEYVQWAQVHVLCRSIHFGGHTVWHAMPVLVVYRGNVIVRVVIAYHYLLDGCHYIQGTVDEVLGQREEKSNFDFLGGVLY